MNAEITDSRPASLRESRTRAHASACFGSPRPLRSTVSAHRANFSCPITAGRSLPNSGAIASMRRAGAWTCPAASSTVATSLIAVASSVDDAQVVLCPGVGFDLRGGDDAAPDDLPADLDTGSGADDLPNLRLGF